MADQPSLTAVPSSSQLAATFLLGCTRGGSPGIFGGVYVLVSMLTSVNAGHWTLPCGKLSGENSPVFFCHEASRDFALADTSLHLSQRAFDCGVVVADRYREGCESRSHRSAVEAGQREVNAPNSSGIGHVASQLVPRAGPAIQRQGPPKGVVSYPVPRASPVVATRRAGLDRPSRPRCRGVGREGR